MNKINLFFLFFSFSFLINAHQIDVSTTMLVEKDNNTWFLQVRASLTAFKKEVMTYYEHAPYKTAEEFKSMVLEHLKNNIQISFDGDQELKLTNGLVKLGHEANVVFQITNVPNNIKKLTIKNSSFSSIKKNQSGLVIFKEGFQKEHFILNNDNNHTLSLSVKKNKFEVINTQQAGVLYLNNFLVFSFLLILPIFFYVERKKNIPFDIEDQ